MIQYFKRGFMIPYLKLAKKIVYPVSRQLELPKIAKRHISDSHENNIPSVEIPHNIVISLLEQMQKLEKKSGHIINLPSDCAKQKIRMTAIRNSMKKEILAKITENSEYLDIKTKMERLKQPDTPINCILLTINEECQKHPCFPIISMILPQAIFETVDDIKVMSTRAIGKNFINKAMRDRGFENLNDITDNAAIVTVFPHTDGAHTSNPADFVSINMLKTSPSITTNLYPVKNIIKHLTDEDKAILKEPIYQFHDHEKLVTSKEYFQILDTHETGLRFNSDIVKPKRHAAREACLKLVDAIQKENTHQIVIPNGGSLFLDNAKILHGRSTLGIYTPTNYSQTRGGFNTHYRDLNRKA